MLELTAVVLSGLALVKALERWATPLVIRHRPRGIVDPSSAGFDAGGGLDGGC